MSTEAQRMLCMYVKSQKSKDGYIGAGGKVDEYYTQFGKVLEAVISPWKILFTPINLSVTESLKRDDIYGEFFRFIGQELRLSRPREIYNESVPSSTNAICCLLAMHHQIGEELNDIDIKYLLDRQDKSGGFCASELAPIPDILSTAVALFTLRLIKKDALDASDFIDAHWMECGAFAPTIFDDYSDVEYVFYGLLALGSCR